MKRFTVLIVILFCLAWTARADFVFDWNNAVMSAIRADPGSANPTYGSRNPAMVHVAIFDAVNAIDPKRESYALHLDYVLRDASKRAAAAQAAYLVLVHLFPAQREFFKNELKRQLSMVENPGARNLGIFVGTRAAEAIICRRANDGADRVVNYVPGTRPGQWRPTPPDYSAAVGAQWPKVTPFVLKRGNQFRPGPPPALTSSFYTLTFKYIKLIGAEVSPIRTEEETHIGYYWCYDLFQVGPPLILYNQILQRIAQVRGNTVDQNAYLFAIVNLAMADAGIACWDAKYTYNFWRPVTGIREAKDDRNPLTREDPAWLPLGAPDIGTIKNFTPPFPAYPSGHSTFGAAMFDVLRRYYHTDCITFTFESDNLPGYPRTFTSLSQASEENGESRFYLGVHWIFDNTAGQTLGRQVGEYVFQNALQPLPRR